MSVRILLLILYLHKAFPNDGNVVGKSTETGAARGAVTGGIAGAAAGGAITGGTRYGIGVAIWGKGN
ncbi:hypothetical protein PPM_0211 [Paenibacillus polymyxa M1]|uniref:M1-368 n=1 Tax=Paenibacillus polymyxa (strain SC2) TaxID=886882 RepID=A0A0D5ZCB8_PAEPS|nr:M1-368 [Paenibacillus polymyxa SC2]CCC83148.1 hypothetical protein PPM_0211 [Paenibacillus polymyxa M1]